jgi:RNA polymerase sigma-70 factor (ECF subfamily)
MSNVESEGRVRELLAQSDVRQAVAATLRLYGAEVFGFLTGVTDDPDVADDVFSAFSERLWKGLGSFRWQCSLRTWAYTVARNELARSRADLARKHRGVIGLSTAGSIKAPSQAVTPTMDRSSFRDAFARLRSALSPEDRDLLVLRVDRALPWRDLALLFLGDDASADALTREAARLRKRFQLVKQQLAREAAACGLLHV